MEDKELELLRRYFNLELKDKILEIQKQNNLKNKVKYLKDRVGPVANDCLDEILKDLGYEC